MYDCFLIVAESLFIYLLFYHHTIKHEFVYIFFSSKVLLEVIIEVGIWLCNVWTAFYNEHHLLCVESTHCATPSIFLITITSHSLPVTTHTPGIIDILMSHLLCVTSHSRCDAKHTLEIKKKYIAHSPYSTISVTSVLCNALIVIRVRFRQCDSNRRMVVSESRSSCQSEVNICRVRTKITNLLYSMSSSVYFILQTLHYNLTHTYTYTPMQDFM